MRGFFMKKIFIILLLVITSNSSWSQTKTYTDIIGKWEGEDDTEKFGRIEIIDSTSVLLEIPGEDIPKGTYKVDFSKSPIWFDVIINDGHREMILKGLLSFLDKDTMRWQVNYEGIRKTKFQEDTEETKSIILKRSK